MSWRDRLHVSPSQAEIDVRVELSRRHLSHWIAPERVIIFYEDSMTIASRERVTETMIANCITFTQPDFALLKHRLLPCVYLDGEPHKTKGAMARDMRIDELLLRWHFQPLRFRYNGSLSKERKMEIVDAIQKVLIDA